MTIQTYRGLTRQFIGKIYFDGIGPSGPNDEPFYGPLVEITNWNFVSNMNPVHRFYLAYAVANGGAGGQNPIDSEKILDLVPENIKKINLERLNIIKMFNAFHRYDYNTILKLSSLPVDNNITNDKYIFYEFYNMGYQFEINSIRYDIPNQMKSAVYLYKKALQHVPEWDNYYRYYISYSLGRSLYSDGQYKESLDVLEKIPDESDLDHRFSIMALSSFRIGNKNKAYKFEKLLFEKFPKKSPLINDYKQMKNQIPKNLL